MKKPLENGSVYNLLTIIEFDSVINGKRWYKCRCSCGNEKSIEGRRVTGGKTKSCGCLRSWIGLAHIGYPYKNYIGKKFDRLTVLEYDYNRSGNGSYLLCQCECGNKKVIAATRLITNKARSCGCKLLEIRKNFNKGKYEKIS